jgi:hypothetical protein
MTCSNFDVVKRQLNKFLALFLPRGKDFVNLKIIWYAICKGFVDCV